MAQPLNRYKADLRDFRFLLFEQLQIQDLLGKEPFADWGEDEISMVLDEVYRYATEVSGPLNQIGDQQGCRLENGEVKTPEGFADAWKKIWEAGWRTLSASPDIGGQGAPSALAACTEEMISGANTAFAMYPGLTMGAAEVIGHFGTDRQKKVYLSRMMTGEFAGTMCLTEPHAGSDVGMATTSAKAIGDGTYKIKGTKIFISGGDQDITPNVIHLVLARIEGAEPGTKGLSLFIVPKVRVNEDGSLAGKNDVQVPSIEHKMGINGSATCVLQFGDDDECIGEVVGGIEHQGMKQMFRMMNFARIGVGIQGLAVASSAFLNALEYSRERKQGSSIRAFKDALAPRVPIIQHPNIRQMLLDMKARVEGIRALCVKLASHQDRVLVLSGKNDELAAYHQGQVDLLTPLLKAYGTDQGFRICETAIQCYGGAGYLKDHPVEQYCRDAKIFSIYEGTNAIQSLDLVGRKLGQAGGKNTQALLGDLQKFVETNREHPVLKECIANLQKAQEAVAGQVMTFLGWFHGGEMEKIPLASERFLEMMSELCIGWLLLDQAVIAIEKQKTVSETHPDRAFYEGKKHAAIYFARNVLPGVLHKASLIAKVDMSATEIPDEAFATV